MKHYIGMDLASEVTTVSVMTKEGKLKMSTAVCTSESNLKQLVKSVKGPKQVVFEECGLASWLYSVLEPVCDDVFVCNPKKNKDLSGNAKGDDSDAFNLAERARLSCLSRVWHGGKHVQALKDRLRDYQVMTKESTALKNRIKAIFRNRGISIGTKAYDQQTRDQALLLLEQQALRTRVTHLGEVLDVVCKQRASAQKELIKVARKSRMFKPLISMPQIGEIHAASIIGEVGEPHRFRTRNQFWSYCGFAVKVYESGEYYADKRGMVRKKDRKATTRGLVSECNRTLKYVFKNVALNLAARDWSHEFERLQESGVYVTNARLTLSRKAAAIALHLMKTGENYDEALVFARK
ncbi:MAG: transposase [Bdellovibrionota bacterium]